VPLHLCKRVDSALEQTLPVGLLATFQDLPGDVKVDGVSFFSTFDALLEWKIEDTRVVTEPPEIGFSTCETGAVNARLLTGTNANYRPMESISNTVRLGIFECKGGDDQVSNAAGGELEA